ncbi:unnamed protein product [Pylaiella littoralis]
MSATSATWMVSYPRRSPQQRRPQMRADAQLMATAKRDSKTNQKPRFDWKSASPPHSEKRGLMLSLLPRHPEEGVRQTAGVEFGSSRRAANSPIVRGRAVRFDSVVKMILVPSRLDLSDRLSDELWWNDEDYLQFRLGAIVEGNGGVLLRTLRNKRSMRVCSRVVTAHPRGTQALQTVGARSGSKHRLSSLTSLRRTQPLTPQTSPA